MKRIAAGLPVLLFPVAAWAQEAAEHEGMPQLNFATPLTTSQVVWMAVVFVAFYMLLSRWALPQVEAVLEMRAGSIAGDLDAARQSKAAADAAAAEVAAATRRANAEAQARIAEAVSLAKAEAAAAAEASSRRLEEQLQVAEAQIASASQAAMGALRQVAAQTAAAVVDRLTGQAPEPVRVDAAVDAALAARAA